MRKSDIVLKLKRKFPDIEKPEIKKVVDEIFNVMIDALARGENIEIREIGSFKVKERKKIEPFKKTKNNEKTKFILFRPSKVLKRIYREISEKGEIR